MRDEFTNRRTMFRNTLHTLDEPPQKSVWFNQPPLVFTPKVADARAKFTSLDTFCASYETLSTGATLDKAREELELEDLAHRVGQLLAAFARDSAHEDLAAQVDFSLSNWRKLRNETLLDRARIVRNQLQQTLAAVIPPPVPPPSTVGPNPADYGLLPSLVTQLDKEIHDYELALTAPRQRISSKKALSEQLRPRFAEVEAAFSQLDTLIVGFNTTEPGRHLIAAYLAARTVVDAGHGPSTPPSPTPTPPPNP